MADYKDLGVALRAYRVAADESVEDLSNAIELDSDKVGRIESGDERPSPEVIEQIARHFTLREQEAARLLELAGYGREEFSLDLETDFNIEDLDKEVEAVLSPVFYTDTVNVVSNQYGVIVNFIQTNAQDGGKPIVVSRVGMSHEHAKSVIKVLQESVRRAERKQNPDSKAQ